LAALGQWCARQLDDIGARIPAPVGGFYLFPDFEPMREKLAARGVTTSDELCTKLLEDTGVAILPGSHFGRPSDELTARIAYVDFDGGQALREVAAIEGSEPPDDAFVERCCPRVVTAFERMCEWIDKPVGQMPRAS
jgi:aspartate aminotransferase